MATPHINANNGDYAKIVLMPGDPRRATWIANTFLHDVKLVNDVRGALGYTGYTKNGVRISVQASGMGQPSMAIYSHELYSDYGVEAIIRVGTMGVYQPEIKLRDVVIGLAASTDSPLPAGQVPGCYSAVADFDITAALAAAAHKKGIDLHVGNILSSNIFYDYDSELWKKWAALNILGVEMESYVLYANAALCKKRAACICTATDSFITAERLSAQERQEGLVNMIEVAIAAAEELAKNAKFND